MFVDSTSSRPEQPVLLPWGTPALAELEEGAHPFDGAAWWFSGGAGLLAWTALALLLTGAW